MSGRIIEPGLYWLRSSGEPWQLALVFDRPALPGWKVTRMISFFLGEECRLDHICPECEFRRLTPPAD